jgi:hypothetical protein
LAAFTLARLGTWPVAKSFPSFIGNCPATNSRLPDRFTGTYAPNDPAAGGSSIDNSFRRAVKVFIPQIIQHRIRAVNKESEPPRHTEAHR